MPIPNSDTVPTDEFGFTVPVGTGAPGSEPAAHTAASDSSPAQPYLVPVFDSPYMGERVTNTPDSAKSTFAQ
jgi:hypothetical protein